MRIATPDIQPVPGHFVLVHEPTKIAYVGACKNLRHRQTIWERNFRLAADPKFKWPLAKMPREASSEYTFYGLTNKTDSEVRGMLKANGYDVVNKATRQRSVYKKNPEDML